jgi:hypothetical protein
LNVRSDYDTKRLKYVNVIVVLVLLRTEENHRGISADPPSTEISVEPYARTGRRCRPKYLVVPDGLVEGYERYQIQSNAANSDSTIERYELFDDRIL